MNYSEITTTNWFHVDDLSVFSDLYKATFFHDDETNPAYNDKPYLDVSDGVVYIDVDKQDDTVQICADGCFSGILDPATDSEEGDFDAFCTFIQNHLVDDDAAIIISAGHERTSDLNGSITIITKDAINSESLFGRATEMARQALGNKTWEPIR